MGREVVSIIRFLYCPAYGNSMQPRCGNSRLYLCLVDLKCLIKSAAYKSRLLRFHNFHFTFKEQFSVVNFKEKKMRPQDWLLLSSFLIHLSNILHSQQTCFLTWDRRNSWRGSSWAVFLPFVWPRARVQPQASLDMRKGQWAYKTVARARKLLRGVDVAVPAGVVPRLFMFRLCPCHFSSRAPNDTWNQRLKRENTCGSQAEEKSANTTFLDNYLPKDNFGEKSAWKRKTKRPSCYERNTERT